MAHIKKHWGKVGLHLSLLFFSFLAFFPLLWVLLTAFQPTDSGVSFVLGDIIKKGVTFKNFARVTELIPLAQNFWNTLVSSVIGTLLTLFFCSLAGLRLQSIAFQATIFCFSFCCLPW